MLVLVVCSHHDQVWAALLGTTYCCNGSQKKIFFMKNIFNTFSFQAIEMGLTSTWIWPDQKFKSDVCNVWTGVRRTGEKMQILFWPCGHHFTVCHIVLWSRYLDIYPLELIRRLVTAAGPDKGAGWRGSSGCIEPRDTWDGSYCRRVLADTRHSPTPRHVS